MHTTHSFLALGSILTLLGSAHGYTLMNTYDATNFFDYFNFFTAVDPTSGYVDYVSETVAMADGLARYQNNQVYLGVDYTTSNPASMRASVRVTSDISYTQGLFIADIAHMPEAACGVWPAFWMFGPNWPDSGEIDIIEGVNLATTNSITLHTSAGCTVSNANSLPGTTTVTSNCNQDNAGTGCQVTTSNTNGYGTGFNTVGGGVYAMQWASDGIYVWFFQRGSIPADITSGYPNTANWGTPTASFSGSGCNFNTYFANQNIVFDTTFCGTWAGVVWGASSCASYASTCNDYVANNPGAFQNSYWLINSVKVYQ
ncbi:glycoside hydrolase family 16 protein [Coleophoma cylindrospora]|uniref:endo-1,3(4)-beta-glucanase n=1 Tax=Coleophoma cylindrospora TaxID=1849047 RepID=A0A3D8RGY0_9HELO|nr:glycoside hydrolase family 16 protein [Coleophoma cylindrospora]